MTLLMANHSSYFDVVLLGISQKRNVDFMARSGLFIPVLGGLIRCLGGFPIQRGGGGASGIKETLKRLRQQAMVGMFPEGTRTRDGELQPIKPGVANIARRSGATIVCAGIAGTYEAWPRHGTFPGSYPIQVVFASPILSDDFLDLSEDQALGLIKSRLTDAFAEAKSAEFRLRNIMMF
jgi:1-acyl-sn-glycerol-3-phosphate acyltransferase